MDRRLPKYAQKKSTITQYDSASDEDNMTDIPEDPPAADNSNTSLFNDSQDVSLDLDEPPAANNSVISQSLVSEAISNALMSTSSSTATSSRGKQKKTTHKQKPPKQTKSKEPQEIEQDIAQLQSRMFTTPKDDSDRFGQLMAHHMRELGPIDRMRCEIEIQNTILKYRLKAQPSAQLPADSDEELPPVITPFQSST